MAETLCSLNRNREEKEWSYRLAMSDEESLWVDREQGRAGFGCRVLPLSAQEVAMLAALAEADGRVVSRTALTRAAGLSGHSARRADALLTGLRRALPDATIANVRLRGWILTLANTMPPHTNRWAAVGPGSAALPPIPPHTNRGAAARHPAEPVRRSWAGPGLAALPPIPPT